MKVTKIPALKGIANKVRLDIIQEIRKLGNCLAFYLC